MIPILFDASETSFTSNGIGRLAEATVCEVTEERNGAYELHLEYPTTGELFLELKVGRYIYTTHDDSQIPQAFQIYEITAPLTGFVSVEAWHISYALNSIPVKPFTASGIAGALAGIRTYSYSSNPFTFTTDKTTSGNFSFQEPTAARALLGGVKGSILDTFGAGDYEFDMYNVILHAHRGADNGVTIRYGSNLTALEQNINGAEVCNAVAPFWTDDDVTVYLPDLVVRTGETAGRAIPLDLSDEFDDQPTQAQLRAKAQAIIDGSESYQLKENIKIDFVPLWQTAEYEKIELLSHIKLCDTVHVYHTAIGLTATARCIRVVYDSLRERFKSLELGEPKTTLSQQIELDLSGTMKDTAANAVEKAQSAMAATFEATGYESATGTSGAITVQTRNITASGIYLVTASSYQTRTGYSAAQQALMNSVLTIGRYNSGGTAQGTYLQRAPLTGGGDNAVAALIQCEAGDTIQCRVQQQVGSSGATLTEQTFYARLSIIRIA